MDRSDDAELRELLDDLEGTLTELREELDVGDDAAPSERRRGPLTPGDLLRVTEQHTIPTVVATLEATIRALELLREVIRLTTPEGHTGRRARPLDVADSGAVTGVEHTLDRLRTALAETDLPRDPAARELVEEARSLSETVERRLAATDPPGTRERGVGIEVREEGETGGRGGPETEADDAESGRGGSDGEESAGEGDTPEEEPAVDVEAELQSIKEDVDGRQDET